MLYKKARGSKVQRLGPQLSTEAVFQQSNSETKPQKAAFIDSQLGYKRTDLRYVAEQHFTKAIHSGMDFTKFLLSLIRDGQWPLVYQV